MKGPTSHLVKWIPKTGGSVVSYNAAFEKAVITKLAEQFPKLRAHLKSIAERLIDPHPVVKSAVCYPDFRGSYSIKAVAPALLGAEWDYGRLSVPDGKAAQRAFEEMVSVGTTAQRKSELRKHLLEYCAQDTRSMVELLNWLAAHQSE